MIAELLAGKPEEVEAAAYAALVALTCEDLGARTKPWMDWWSKHGSQPRVEWLLDGLAHRTPEIRLQAAGELHETLARILRLPPRPPRTRPRRSPATLDRVVARPGGKVAPHLSWPWPWPWPWPVRGRCSRRPTRSRSPHWPLQLPCGTGASTTAPPSIVPETPTPGTSHAVPRLSWRVGRPRGIGEPWAGGLNRDQLRLCRRSPPKRTRYITPASSRITLPVIPLQAGAPQIEAPKLLQIARIGEDTVSRGGVVVASEHVDGTICPRGDGTAFELRRAGDQTAISVEELERGPLPRGPDQSVLGRHEQLFPR